MIALVLRLVAQGLIGETGEDGERLFQIAGACHEVVLLKKVRAESVQRLLVCECVAKSQEALQLTA